MTGRVRGYGAGKKFDFLPDDEFIDLSRTAGGSLDVEVEGDDQGIDEGEDADYAAYDLKGVVCSAGHV